MGKNNKDYMTKMSRIFLSVLLMLGVSAGAIAQVNGVVFGKNRLQFEKFKWQYYQTANFNVYFNEGGQELAKYVMQTAEAELPQIEAAAEYSMQRRATIVLYNNFTDYKQTNIGLETDRIVTGGVTQLVNNKMVIYFDANHDNLKRQIRQGIADVITKNVLFGDDIGEVAGNQTLLDLPQWLTDGYIAYLGENWSVDLDDDLKSEILSGKFNKFSSLSYNRPLLAGHAFWYFIEEKYKKENVTYFLYLARVHKSLNRASQQITKLKFNALLREFMEYNNDKYYEDIRKRKAYPKGSYIDGFDISQRLNYYRFNVNPVKRNNSYVVTQFRKGIVRVILNDDYEIKTLLKYGNLSYENEINPNYPIMAWDPKGTRIAVAYSEEGKLKLFVYDVLNRYKEYKIELGKYFDQVQDIQYMLDSKTLLISGVNNGHTDIYTFDIAKEKVKMITNDIYDDIDPTFVAFPGKTGILYSSNRPSPAAPTGDSILPHNNSYNVFLITDFGDKPELNQISQLTNLKYGDARYPTQYNDNHFTFVSSENGIANRYAGFFTSKKEGLDTLILIGDVILRNPNKEDVDSTLLAYKKTDIDSVAIVSVSADSVYTFPLTNYPSNLAESRIAGDNNQVSEVTRQSDVKTLYKLKIDENTLRRRNVTAQPTAYAKKLQRESRFTDVDEAGERIGKEAPKPRDDFFQSEFDKTDKDSIPLNPLTNKPIIDENPSVLTTAKLYKYKPVKFSVDYGGLNVNNSVILNRYQPYAGGQGPIQLNGNNSLNGLLRLGTTELMEDLKINGAFKIGSNLKDNEWFANFQNLRKRVDWGVSYYRNTQTSNAQVVDGNGNLLAVYPAKIFTNIYMGNVSYPFSETKRISLFTGLRNDRQEILSSGDALSLLIPAVNRKYSVNKLEYVYDNSINRSTNIMNGLRYKVYADWNVQIGKKETGLGKNTYNVGFDARYYYPIFRDFIWANRVAGDFSFGNQKLIYYLGGTDGWLLFGNNLKANGDYRYFNAANTPAPDVEYAFQSLAVNMRGYIQNLASGNNAVVINSELRMPVVSTIFDKTVSNAFLRDFQLTSFVDFGTAWNGGIENIKRPSESFNTSQGGNPPFPGTVTVNVKAPGVGPFAGGYGFGARSTLLGYFVRFDAAWRVNGVFKGKPQLYVSLGLDF